MRKVEAGRRIKKRSRKEDEKGFSLHLLPKEGSQIKAENEKSFLSLVVSFL